MKQVAVLLADGCEEVEAITPIDFLRRAGANVTAVGVTGQTITGGHDIRIAADMVLSDVGEEFIAGLHTVVIPGGTAGAENIAASDSAMNVIRECLSSGKLVAAICAAPGVVLGGHGLVGGRKFTCYPGFEERVRDGQFLPERVVVDGTLITSRGPGTAAEFSLKIIENLIGSEVASKLRHGTLQPD